MQVKEVILTEMANSSGPEAPYTFDLSGGVICLDFANTVSRRKVPQLANDHLRNYDDLVAFCQQSQMFSVTQADELRAQARRRHRQAEETLRRAISCRESIYNVFSALAEGKPAGPDDIRHINDLALEALGHRQLELANGHYRWEWQWSSRDLECILWPIAQSAADLLTSPELRAVRMCEAPECAWLFLDQSRNHTRRWCDMKVCGNRQKARRHYQRAHR